MGIAQTFTDFIKILYPENISTITNNGFFFQNPYRYKED